jgi:hypothetical protein
VSIHLERTKEHQVLDYLEDLLMNDRARLLRMMSYLKERIYEEEAKARSLDVINRMRHGSQKG